MKRVVIITLIVFLAVVVYSKNKQPPPPQQTITTSQESNVTVEVEKDNEKSTEQELVFNVILDTHSVDLDAFNLGNNIFLEKDIKKIKPQRVNVSGSIHHKNARVSFPSSPTPFTVVITNLDGISRREYEFK